MRPVALDPIEFLRAHPPFDRLDAAGLRRVEDELEVVYYPRGTAILQRGGEPSRHLYVVRKGAVRLEREGRPVRPLEEGDCFGFPSLIGRASPSADAVAVEDTLVYRLPSPAFDRLMETPEVSRFFLQDLASRLREAAADESQPVGRELATSVGRLARGATVSVPAGATVQEAAAAMRDARVSSVLVQGETGPQGIVTDRDLRSRVLAAGKGPLTPVAAVMSRPVLSLPATASLFAALLFMLEHGVHHIPVVEGGHIAGVLTDTDLLRLLAKSPLHLLRAVSRFAEPAELADYALELAGVVEAMFWSGIEAAEIGRIAARLNDALVVRLLALAEAELGPPPTPYAWIVHGSEGRMEQTLITDQDNALVYRDATPAAEAYFAKLADKVVNGLLAASFPPCAGGFMATRWHRPLAEWEGLFRGWIERPEPQSLMKVFNFFDFRAVHGALDLAPLAELMRIAGREGVFLAQLARASLEMEPPLGLLRQIREEDGGVDLKKGGLLPIVSLARLHALEAGSAARSTLERLEDAARAGTLSPDGAATLAEAFRFLQRLRLRGQLQTLRAGGRPGNHVRLAELSPLERVNLKEVFLALREMQAATALHYSTNRLG